MAEDRTNAVLILLAAAALAVIVATFALTRRSAAPPAPPKPALTEDEKAYAQNLVVSDARMSAARNFLGDTVVYLDARVTNKGPKAVRRLELGLVFVDTLNQVVLRETARPITLRTPPLRPGETRSFQVTFERMPADWDEAPPVMAPIVVNF